MSFRSLLRAFYSEESGQDLAEYCLLTALLTIVAAAIFVYASGGVQAIWNDVNGSLTAGNPAPAGAASSTSAH